MPEQNSPQEHSLPKGIIWGIAALILIFAVSLGIFLYDQSKHVAGSVAENLGKLEQGVNDLKNLDADAAKKNFGEAGGFGAKGDIWQEFGSVFGGARDLIAGFQGVTKEGITLAEEVSFFENNLPELLLNQKGDEIISHLTAAQESLKRVSEQSDKLSSNATKLNSLAPSAVDFYIPFKLDLSRYESILDSFLAWLKADSPHHLLVMLQNPSEIRPAGGFLGSYADVVLDHANIASVDIHDINDAAKGFDAKIIPPRPLQAAITSWKAADANWFFDFSKSASQVIKFMEASRTYASSSTVFDGALAVSPKVMSDILEITGPVAVSSTRVVLNKDNFLLELQKMVQQGQASLATYPKASLKELASGILEKLRAFDAPKRRELFGLVYKWAGTRDIMLYFSAEGGSASGGKDHRLEDFLDYYGISGKIYEITPDFEGDYLAIVDANLGGGKSDIFIVQTSTLESQINADGTVSNHLVIERKHNGAAGKYWWYKTANLDYLQLFLSPTAELMNFKGGIEKNIVPPLNYAKNGYVADDYVAAIESSTEKVFSYPAVFVHPESGKKVFATWSKMAVGEKTQIVFDYKTRLYLPPADGTKYRFVFDKQAGTSRNYKFTFSAPVGFKFKENNLPVYEYAASDPAFSVGGSATSTSAMPGRLILNLTLERV